MAASSVSISIVKDCLVVPVQIEVYDEVLLKLKEDVARIIRQTAARGVIIDVSGIYVLDSHDFLLLCEIGEVARCLGAPTVFCGFQPGVVMAMVNTKIEIPPIESALNLGEAFVRLLGKDYNEEKKEDESRQSAEEEKTAYTESGQQISADQGVDNDSE